MFKIDDIYAPDTFMLTNVNNSTQTLGGGASQRHEQAHAA